MKRKNSTLPVAVIGFGSQGRAQARRLRASGLKVRVGLPAGSGARREARRLGFDVTTAAEAVRGCGAVALLVPDRVGGRLLGELAPRLEPGCLVVFAAGYPLVFTRSSTPAACDIVLVAPHGPGRDLEAGRRVSGFVGVFQDVTGRAAQRARKYARGIGLGPLFETTPRAEALGDLFGEQVLLCGGLAGLAAATVEVMIRNGLPPENAYFETVAQLERLSALLCGRGIDGFFAEISDCAAYGMTRAAPRLVDARLRRTLQEIWDRIADGRFARGFQARGRPAGLPPLFAPLRRLSGGTKKR